MSSDSEDQMIENEDTENIDDTDQNEEPKHIKNEMVDKLTLELLMNKSHYNRYIAQVDPVKHEKHVKFQSQINKYKRKIIDMTTELVSSPTKQITNDVNDAFTDYIKTLINYFEMKDIENQSTNNPNDEDTLFGSIDETHSEPARTSYDNETGTTSLWGGSQVIKRKTKNINHFMHGFPRK